MSTSGRSEHASEYNVNTVTSSTLSNSPIVAGSGASARVTAGGVGAGQDVADAVAGLRSALAELAVQDDDTADRVALALGRLDRLEQAATSRDREPGRLRGLLGQVTEGLAGLAGVAGGLEALRTAVEKLLR
jgi:hypothetical protein